MRTAIYFFPFLLLTIFSGCKSTSKLSERIVVSDISELNASEIKTGSGTIAITGATIIDGTGGEPIANGCVIVSGNMITAVGVNGAVPIPEGASVVDAKGMSLLPGFIDAHFHLDGQKGLPTLFLKNGVTSVRDPGAWMHVYNGERSSGDPVPRLFLSGPHIDMFPPAYPHDAFVVRDAEEAVKQVNRAVDSGSTVIKVYFRLPPSIIREVCKAAHARGIPVTSHLEITEAMEAIDAGVDGVEHITSFGLSLSDDFEAEKFRQKVLGDNNARRRGRYEMWSMIDTASAKAARLLAYLRAKATFVSPTLAAFEYQFPEDGNNKDSVEWKGFANMKAMTGFFQRNGVPVVVGSHSSVKYAKPGWAFHREMELLSESGMSNAAVIRAATMENARFFRIDKKLGSITKGKIADLILVSGDPLRNISEARNISRVMLNGAWIN